MAVIRCGHGVPPLLQRGDGLRLVLWDVDGTLLHSGGHGGRTFTRAVERVIGREMREHRVPMAGKTDPQIALDVLAAAAIAEDEARHHLPHILRLIEEELAAVEDQIAVDGYLLPGVEEVVRRLHADPSVVQSAVTGNLAANAVVKLRAFGIDTYVDFEVGGYGSDSHDRNDLVHLAVARAGAKYGVTFDPRDVWVIGDTERDLACARAAGARCLLVATGIHDYDTLAPLGADVVLPDLGDVDAVVRLLTDG